ncbi:MAG: glycoside hydrolase family 3 protein, partial [Rhodothermia bacterium]
MNVSKKLRPILSVAAAASIFAALGSSGPSTIDHRPSTSSWADSVLATLTLEQKVGQLFVVRASGVLYNENDRTYRRLVNLVEEFNIGGVAFFRGEPVAQAMLTNDLQERATIPLLISEDMEWGVGMRLSRTTEFPKTMSLGATRDPDLAYAMGRVVAAEARALGVHVNFAPVADVNNNPTNPVINVRSYGEDPALVGSMASAYARGLQDGGLIATAKHFPGHGDTDVDSHSGLPVLTISRQRLDSLELIPFRQTIASGVGSIMVAHISLPEIEGEPGIPASLSARVVTQILRNDLGFDGLVVTDAMGMKGITNGFGSGEAALRSLRAGVDQILLPADFYAARRAVLRALENGTISEARIDKSVRRILVAKAISGLASYRPADVKVIRETVADPSASALAHEIARRAVTLLSNEGDLIPLKQTDIRILDITLSDSDDMSRGQTFDRLLRRYLPQARVKRVLLDLRSHESEFERALQMADKYDLIVVQSYMIVRTGSGKIGLDSRSKRFLNDLIPGDQAVILVAFGDPYIARDIEKPDAYVAAYGSSNPAVLAVAQALTGQIGFQGKLPVTVRGRYEYGDGIVTSPIAIRYGVPEDV